MNALSLDIYLAPNPSESLLLYSTDSGYVNCLTFNEDQMVKMTARQKGRVEHIFLEKESSMKKIKMLGTLWMRKAHGDWALKVKYIPELRAIVSCSPDLNESLVVAELDNNHKWQFHVSPVHKGVSCFSYCKSPAIIATGGLDRQVRLWNPHKLNHPRAILKGHVAPIIDLSSNANHGQIISLSSDKVVKVWDISKQVCLQTINNTLIQTPDDTLSTISFINGSHQLSLITTSNMLFRYKHNLALKKQGNNPKSHEQPVRCILYNSIFNQIVTGCDGGVVNVWDFSSGAKTFRFVINDGNVEITTMCFDSQGRRLITGLRDGRIQIWNFNNGELLQELRKGNDCEVTKIIVSTV
jgi:WD40 repeat protein